MEELKFRIQRRNNLNTVYVDPKRQEKSNATHDYQVECLKKTEDGLIDYGVKFSISFQNGARHEPDCKVGVLDSDLLEIVRHRLQGFQSGEYATRENAMALTHVEQALMWLAKRADDRDERGVLGTMTK